MGGNQLTIYPIFPTTRVLVTACLTTLRVVQVQRLSAQFGLTLKRRFNPVIEIIVESAALFTISLIGYAIFLVLHTLYRYPEVNMGYGRSLCAPNNHDQISMGLHLHVVDVDAKLTYRDWNHCSLICEDKPVLLDPLKNGTPRRWHRPIR